MKKSTTDVVLEAIQDLFAQDQYATRETIAQVTGLSVGIIDDRVKALINDGLVHRVQRGVFKPEFQHPEARLISKTMLPDGTVKLEIGDDHVLTLTPREARNLGNLMIGDGMQFSSIESGQHAAVMASKLARQISSLQRQLMVITEGGHTPVDLPVDGDFISVDSHPVCRIEASTQPSTSASHKPSTKKTREKVLKARRQARWRKNLNRKLASTEPSTSASHESSTKSIDPSA